MVTRVGGGSGRHFGKLAKNMAIKPHDDNAGCLLAAQDMNNTASIFILNSN